MNKKDLQTVERIIVHGNCPDGMASAILLYDALKIEPEFHTHNTAKFRNLKITPNTLFCDISPPKHLANAFKKEGGFVLDHHVDQVKVINKFGERGVYSETLSGAGLAFEEVWMPMNLRYGLKNRDHVAPRDFAKIAGIRDLWQRNEPDWKLGCHQAACLTFYDWNYWKEKIDCLETDFSSYIDIYKFSEEMKVGKMVYHKRLAMAEKCAYNAYIGQIGDYKIAIFNDYDKLISDVAEILREKGCNIIAGFRYFKNSENDMPIISFGIRSDDTFNCSKFAGSIKGGGGHKKAAGFSLFDCMNSDPFSIFMNELENYVR